ncbi:sigma-70 family RNA polymerase sigma factor [Candidatus Hydrogenedentota bacterium]
MVFQRTLTDTQAVRKVLSGNRDAYEILVRRYLNLVHAVAYGRVGNRGEVEDIVQETFVKAFKSLDTLKEKGKFRQWLVSITRNLCINSSRIAEQRVRLDRDMPAREDSAPNIEQRELHEILRSQIMNLEPDAREILLLHYFAGFKIREIADTLGISGSAAAKRIQRARKTLGEKLVGELEAAVESWKPEKERSSMIMGVIISLPAMPVKLGPLAGAQTLGGVIAMKKTIVGLAVVIMALCGLWLTTGPDKDVSMATDLPEKSLPLQDRAGPSSTDITEIATAAEPVRESPSPGPPVEDSQNEKEEQQQNYLAPTPVTEELPATEDEVAVSLDPNLLRGIVVNKEGSPVGDVAIYTENFPRQWNDREKSIETRTEADGTFTLEGDNIRQKRLFALHPDYAPGSGNFNARTIEEDPVRIVLSPGGTMEGVVTLDGEPCENGRIHYDGKELTIDVKTEEDGSYRMAGLPIGATMIGVTPEAGSGRDRIRIVTVKANEVTRVDFDFSGSASRIKGVVKVEGTPVTKGNATLYAGNLNEGFEFFTARIKEGQYSFDGVPAGDAGMRVHGRLDDGTSFAKRVNFTVPEDETVVRNVNVSLDTALSGEIISPEGVNVVDGGIVALQGEVPVTELSIRGLMALIPLAAAEAPANRGSYRFAGLTPGTYTLVVIAHPERTQDRPDTMDTLEESLEASLFAGMVVEVIEGEDTVADLVLE